VPARLGSAGETGALPPHFPIADESELLRTVTVAEAGSADAASDRRAVAGLALLWLAVAAVLVGIVVWRYAIFRNDVDLGIFTQVISFGHGFSSTAEGSVNHLLVHWSPIIVVAWPFLRAFGPLGLEICQALLVSATLFPIWGLARARFNAYGALAVVAVAAIYPILCANAVGDFHETAFVPVLSATFVFALDRRRWRLGLACALLLACTREDQFVALAFNGIACAAFARGDAELRRFGWLTTAVAVAGFALYFGVVRNVLQPHVTYGSLEFFDWSGSSLSAGGLGAILAPRAQFVWTMLAPLLFLPCISRYGAFLLPGFVEILASHRNVTLLPGEHYSALLTGYALAAFVDGVARIAAWKARAGVVALSVAALSSAWFAIYASPMEYWYYLYRAPNAHDAALQRTLDGLPRDADVGSEDEIFAHLGLDPNASIDMLHQDWFVYDRTHYSDRWHFVDEPVVRRLVAQRAYVVASDRDGIVVLHRAPNP